MRQGDHIWLTMREGCALLGIDRTALNRRILGGEYATETVTANGGEQYRIRLDSLAAEAQARYYVERHNLHDRSSIDAEASMSEEDEQALWRRYEDASEKLKKRAETNLAAVIAWHDGLRQGKARMALYAEIRERFGIARKALNEWLAVIEERPRHCWLALLVPNYKGLDNAKKADWTPEAWNHFLVSALTPGAKIRTAWWRTKRESESKGWQVPSYDTAKRTVLPLAGAKSSFRLLPAGRFRSGDGRPNGIEGWYLDASLAETLIRQAKAQSNDYVIDYEHQTQLSSKNGQPAPAAGWFKDLEWREGDGLYVMNAKWTDSAAKMLQAQEYRYVSPVFLFDGKTGAVRQIVSAAITNSPALDGLTDLAAAKRIRPELDVQQDDIEGANASLQRVFGKSATLVEPHATHRPDKQPTLAQYDRDQANEDLKRVFGRNAALIPQ